MRHTLTLLLIVAAFFGKAAHASQPCPRPLKITVPHYPALGRINARVSGVVDVDIAIAADGSVRRAKAAQSPGQMLKSDETDDYLYLYELLIGASEQAAQYWTFGNDTEIRECSVQFVFTLVRGSQPVSPAIVRLPASVEVFEQFVRFTASTALETQGEEP